MKQSLAHTCVILSLVLSSISFILSLIAFYLPNWKYIQLRTTSLSIYSSEDHQMDPLIRNARNQYTESLYRLGDVHSLGLLTHCVSNGTCGRNYLPSFRLENYKICHDIIFHQQCIFSNILSSSSKKCTCEKPSYISTTYILLIIILVFEFLFFLANLLRLYRRYCHYLNDIQLRLITIISTLFSSIFLIIIIIQHNNNRLTEALEFFYSMHRYYLHEQIYSFSNNLDLITKQIEQSLDIRLGACYICVIFILILTLLCFLTSSIIEIKISSTFDENEKKSFEQNHRLILHPPPLPIPKKRTEHFVPSESMRFTRQTKV